MKTRNKMFLASAMSGFTALAAVVGVAALAAAAETPTITATVQNTSNANITSALVGASVHASVTIASSTASTSPTGTVDFNLYSNQSCTGSPLAQTGVALVNGSASSSAATVPAGGLSYIVHYNGQGDLYASANSNCVSISSSQVAPTLSLSLSNTNVQAGSFVYAVPNLQNETVDADGTLQYNVYSNNTCTTLALSAGSKTVTNGATPNSDSWQFITPGTYYWQGVYSGDASNAAATSSCTGAILTVTATTTQFSPTISTQLSNSSVVAGSSVYDSATLSNASSNAGGSVSYKVYTNNSCTAGAIDAGTKTVVNAGVPNSNSILFNTPGTYYWQAVYSGDGNNSLATSSCQSEVLTVSATSTPPTGTPGTISGTVFNDLNKNDKQNNGEPGLSGWTVWLHKAATTTDKGWWNWFRNNNKNLYNAPIVATATTDANGNYSFPNLSAGTYFVEESVTAGWKQTSDDTKVVLTAAKTSADVDFSNVMKKATTTNNGASNHDKDKDKKDDVSKNNGWFQYSGNIPVLGNVFGWLHLSMK